MRYCLPAVLLAASAFAPVAAQDSSVKPDDAAQVAAACGGELYPDDIPKMSKAAVAARLTCFTREAAKRFNATLPKKVDEKTTLESVSAQGTQLIYHYRVDFARADIKPGALDAFKPTVAAKVCNAADMKSIVRIGGSYRYEWIDRNGVAIGSLVVDSCPGS
jgi:hypothetical protein